MDHRDASVVAEEVQGTGPGTAWVLVQAVLLGLIGLAPFCFDAVLPWTEPLMHLGRGVGPVLVVLGGSVVLVAGLSLGTNLTIYPRPKAGGTLTQTGLYALVRHPIYSGLLLVACGWACWHASTPAFLLTLLLSMFFDRKARREERWLRHQYPTYSIYSQRVARLIPWLY